VEFNDGNEWHYVTDPGAYLRERDMYEMRACSASGGRPFVDPEFYQQRDAMAGVRCFMAYQFPYQNAGSPEYQADFFCDTLGKLRPNEIIMLDTEARGGLSDPAGFLYRWCARAESRLNTLAVIYVPSALAGALTRVVTGPRLVKAPRYSGGPNRGAPPWWPYDIWQYTDRGWFPGSPHGPGDVNYTDLATEQVLAHCRGDQDAARRRKVLLLND
jgi:Glycosyl hydrolases family 25